MEKEVAVAFNTFLEVILEEIDNTIAALNREGARAFQSGNYDLARELMEKGSQIISFRKKVLEVQSNWNDIMTIITKSKGLNQRSLIAEKRAPGLRTPADEFRLPILKSLADLGGSATVTEVLDRVEKMMYNRLSAHDRSTLPSKPTQIRWRNTAQWARLDMVQEGLLSSKSPRGVWELTEAGIKWLSTFTEEE
jgi:hypothetical protein